MSADYAAGPFKAYGHESHGIPWIHVRYADPAEAPLGNFALDEITALAELAGQAWPSGPGVEVRYVIEVERLGDGWMVMWSCRADEDGETGVPEGYALRVFAEFNSGARKWRLVRRTTVQADEVLEPADDGDGS